MASSADVREIMGMAPHDTTITKDVILGTDKKKYYLYLWSKYRILLI